MNKHEWINYNAIIRCIKYLLFINYLEFKIAMHEKYKAGSEWYCGTVVPVLCLGSSCFKWAPTPS